MVIAGEKSGTLNAISTENIFVFIYPFDMTISQKAPTVTIFNAPQKITIFTIYNADGDGSTDDFQQYPFAEESAALAECAGFMKDMLKDGIMFDADETAKMFAPITLALAREDIRDAMDVFNDEENQMRLRVRVKTLNIK